MTATPEPRDEPDPYEEFSSDGLIPDPAADAVHAAGGRHVFNYYGTQPPTAEQQQEMMRRLRELDGE